MKRFILSIFVGTLLLASGCGTIDQRLIDQAQVAIDHWLDRKTNAPPASVDLPAAPVAMPAWDVKHHAAAGNVNWWGQSNPDVELDKLVATGIPAYHIELFGWGETHGYDSPDAVLAALARLKAACIARDIRLIVSLCNDNQGQLKHKNTDPRTLAAFRAQVSQALRWLQANKWPGLYIQTVAETQTVAGRAIEVEASDMFPPAMLIYNGDGGAPTRIPAWAFNAAYHKTHLTDPVPRGYIDSSDHGTQLNEYGGTQAQDYKDDAVEGNAARASANGSPCWLYMFQQRVMSVSDLAALHRGYYGAPPPPPKPPKPPEPTGDSVPFKNLTWNRGGYNGAKAVRDPAVTLTACSVRGNTLRYAGTGLTKWPAQDGGNVNGICSIFFDGDGDGLYERGGKFDWCRSNAADRPMSHLTGYNGWDGYPAIGTPFAYVLTTPSGDKRSNVISGRWEK